MHSGENMRAQTPPPSTARKDKKNNPAPNTRKTTARKSNTRRASQIAPANPDTKVLKQGNVYFLFHKERRGISWRLAITIILVFFVGVGSAVSFATIHNARRQMTASLSALVALQQENHFMEAATVERYTRDEIMRRARELGFGEPDPSQIIYFYTPVYSNVTFTYTPHAAQENHFWQGVMAFLRSIADRIFR